MAVPTVSVAAPADRRAKRMNRTREALVEAALALFAEQGYNQTTVEQITDRADVSRRTFFRYFASKEDILSEEKPYIPVELIASQPAEASDLEAVRLALLELAPQMHPLRTRLRLLRTAMKSSPTLRGLDHDQRRLTEEFIARGVAARRGLSEPDADARLAGLIGLAVFRMANDEWLDDDRHEELAPLVDHYFARMVALGPVKSVTSEPSAQGAARRRRPQGRRPK